MRCLMALMIFSAVSISLKAGDPASGTDEKAKPLVPGQTDKAKMIAGLPVDGVFHFGEHEGYLVIPPNYQTEKKYPLIVNFTGPAIITNPYRLRSEALQTRNRMCTANAPGSTMSND